MCVTVSLILSNHSDRFPVWVQKWSFDEAYGVYLCLSVSDWVVNWIVCSDAFYWWWCPTWHVIQMAHWTLTGSCQWQMRCRDTLAYGLTKRANWYISSIITHWPIITVRPLSPHCPIWWCGEVCHFLILQLTVFRNIAIYGFPQIKLSSVSNQSKGVTNDCRSVCGLMPTNLVQKLNRRQNQTVINRFKWN